MVVALVLQSCCLVDDQSKRKRKKGGGKETSNNGAILTYASSFHGRWNFEKDWEALRNKSTMIKIPYPRVLLFTAQATP